MHVIVPSESLSNIANAFLYSTRKFILLRVRGEVNNDVSIFFYVGAYLIKIFYGLLINLLVQFLCKTSFATDYYSSRVTHKRQRLLSAEINVNNYV